MATIYWPFPPEQVIEWPGTRPAGWAAHIGTDWPVVQGTRLRATVSGVVDVIWDDGLGAWVIDIHTPDGWVIRNGHLSAMSPRDGQWVNAGDDIGATGGRPGTAGAGLSTGDHFHWEIRNNNGWSATGWYDPRKLAIRTFGSPSKSSTPAKKGTKKMLMTYFDDAAGKGKRRWAVFGPGFWLEIETQVAANNIARQLGFSAFKTDAGGWAKFKRVSLAGK